MRRHNRVLMCLLSWDEFIEEAKELVHLRLRKISVIRCVLHLEGVDLRALAGNYVGKRAEARVADWNPDRVAAVFLKKLDQDAFAVEASFAPASKGDFVDFFDYPDQEFVVTANGSLCVGVIKDYRTWLNGVCSGDDFVYTVARHVIS